MRKTPRVQFEVAMQKLSDKSVFATSVTIEWLSFYASNSTRIKAHKVVQAVTKKAVGLSGN